MLADFSKETLEHFNVDADKQKQIRESLLLFKRMNYFESQQKNKIHNKTTFCQDCQKEVTNIKRHEQSAKHKKNARG